MNIWSTDNFIFRATNSGVDVYNESEALLGVVTYIGVSSVWANDSYLYISTTNSGVIRSLISSISGAVYNDLNIYKSYPDICNNDVNYIHGNGNYLCVATVSGVDIINMITSSGVYTNSSIIADKCYQLSDRTSYYIYDDKLMTVYNDDSTYLYAGGDGIIPTISGINDLYIVDSINNLILLATTNGVVVIEENKGDEANSRFKYYYRET